MADRPRDLPGVSDIIGTIPAVSSPLADDDAPTMSLPEDSIGLRSASFADGFKNINQNVSYRVGTSIFESLQVAFGGVVDAGVVQPDPLPNTFLDPANNVYSTVEFSVVDHDEIILLVRILGNDNRFYPRPGDDPDAAQVSLRAEYDNGAEFFTSVPLPVGPNTGGQNFQQTEEIRTTSGAFEDSTFTPFIFRVPLRSIITFVTIQSSTYSLSLSLRVRRSPGVIDEFGFLAINRTNAGFSMSESRVARSFGLVMDQVGAWDILVSPEAICSLTNSSAEANFSYTGKLYGREPLDVDESFIMGIGDPNVNTDNDILSFTNTLPDQVKNNISIFPVSGYPRVWVLRLQPPVRAYLMALRASAPPNSLQGCFVDIPLYARGTRSLAEGTANVRVFAEVACVFDYNFCEFYWNLGNPLPNRPASPISASIDVQFEELVDCGTDATVDENGNVTATSFFIVTIKDLPALDNGNLLLLLKMPTPPNFLRRIYKPSDQIMLRLKRLPTAPGNPPWEFDCQQLTATELAGMNKLKMYIGGLFANPITDPAEIATRSVTEPKILVVQPRFNFPPADEISPDTPTEKVAGSIGFTFRNWRNADNTKFSETMLLAAEFYYPSSAAIDLKIQLQAKAYYNEDRRILT